MQPRALLLAGMIVGLASDATAQPATVVQIAGETWKQSRSGAVDQFTRTDGTIVEVTAVAVPCSKQTRTGASTRLGWMPPAYWPTLDLVGGKVIACLEHGSGTETITVIPTAGKAVGPDVAPILDAIATQLRPPTEVSTLGRIHPSIPIVLAVATTMSFAIDGAPATVGVVVSETGSCAYENASVMIQVGKLANRPFAAGYWPTLADGKDGSSVYGCLELRQGYMTLVVKPATAVAPLADVLQEIRRAAYATHGGPISSELDPLELPATKQRVPYKQAAGLWKVVDGARFQYPGADVLVSTAGLGMGSTMYSIAVREGPCTPGAKPLGGSTTLFPLQLGPAWVLDDDPLHRWSAWACVGTGTETATITVFGTITETKPPKPDEAATIRTMVEQIARSYGVELPADGITPYPIRNTLPTGYRRDGGRYGGFVGGYFGVISLAPEGAGDRRTGGLVGVDLRFANRGFGGVFAFDLELGYGGGEVLGEIRVGGGLALGPLHLVAGGSVGSIGPAAALDGFGEVSLSLQTGRAHVWIGARRAYGVGGPDHDQLSAKLVLTGKDESGVYVGARLISFGIDEDTLLETGTAILVTFGGGVASTN